MARNEVTLRDMVMDKLVAMANTTKDKLVAGSISDFTGYRESIARLRALHDAVEVIDAVFKGSEE